MASDGWMSAPRRHRRARAATGCSALLVVALTGCGGDGGRKATPFTVTASEYRFDVPAEIAGGVVRVTVENRGTRRHEAVILEVGATGPEQVAGDLAAAGQEEPLPEYLRYAGGLADVDPGESAASTQLLPEGSYVVVCALSDADLPGGQGRFDRLLAGIQGGASEGRPPPHFTLGMIRAFRVTKGTRARLPRVDGAVVARDYEFEVPDLGAGRRDLAFRNEGPDETHTAVVAEYPEGVDEAQARRSLATALAPAGTAPDRPPEVVARSGLFAPGLGGTFPLRLRPGRTYVVVCVLKDRGGGPPHVLTDGMFAFFRAR